MKSKDSNSKKSVSYQKKDGRGHVHSSFFCYDNDKDLKVCFLVTCIILHLEMLCLFFRVASEGCRLKIWFEDVDIDNSSDCHGNRYNKPGINICAMGRFESIILVYG